MENNNINDFSNIDLIISVLETLTNVYRIYNNNVASLMNTHNGTTRMALSTLNSIITYLENDISSDSNSDNATTVRHYDTGREIPIVNNSNNNVNNVPFSNTPMTNRDILNRMNSTVNRGNDNIGRIPRDNPLRYSSIEREQMDRTPIRDPLLNNPNNRQNIEPVFYTSGISAVERRLQRERDRIERDRLNRDLFNRVASTANRDTSLLNNNDVHYPRRAAPPPPIARPAVSALNTLNSPRNYTRPQRPNNRYEFRSPMILRSELIQTEEDGSLVQMDAFTEIINNLQNVIVHPSTLQINNATESYIITEEQFLNNERLICPITREELIVGDHVCVIKHCNHLFKNDALMQWFNSNVRCPVCRYDIRDYVSSPSSTSNEENEVIHDDDTLIEENLSTSSSNHSSPVSRERAINRTTSFERLNNMRNVLSIELPLTDMINSLSNMSNDLSNNYLDSRV